MKKIFFLILFFLSFSSLYVGAFQVSNSGDFQNGKLFIGQEINDDYYAAGGDVVIDSKVYGDLVVAGGNIVIDGNISQDLMVVGGNVTINADVGDDIRIFGGNVTINGHVGDDLFMAGGSLTTKSGSTISGDLTVSAGTIMVNANVYGDVNLNGSVVAIASLISGNMILRSNDISFLPYTKIAGDIEYHAKNEIANVKKYVEGAINYVYVKKYTGDDISHIYDGFFMYKSAFLIIFGLLIYFLFSKGIKNIINEVVGNYFSMFLKGLLVYASIPFVIILLFSTVFGIPFGLLLLVMYIFLWVFTKLLVLVCLTGYLKFIFTKDKENKFSLVFEIASLVVLALILSILPYWVSLLVGFFVVGGLGNRYYTLLKKETV